MSDFRVDCHSVFTWFCFVWTRTWTRKRAAFERPLFFARNAMSRGKTLSQKSVKGFDTSQKTLLTDGFALISSAPIEQPGRRRPNGLGSEVCSSFHASLPKPAGRKESWK